MTPRSQHDPASVLPLSHVAYHMLLALATENRHGYGIIKHVAERTGGQVELEAGTLYAAIKRMTHRLVPEGSSRDRRVSASLTQALRGDHHVCGVFSGNGALESVYAARAFGESYPTTVALCLGLTALNGLLGQ